MTNANPEVTRQWKLCVDRLRRAGRLQQSEKIEGCSKKEPCNDGSCPKCLDRAKLQSVKGLLTLATNPSCGEQIFFVTIAPPTYCIPLQSIHEFAPVRLGRHIKYALRDAPIKWGVFSMDFSFNEHEAKRFERFFMPHVHGMVATSDPRSLKTCLAKAFPRSDIVPRPTRIDEWDGDSRAIEYIFKATATRRISRDGVARYDAQTGRRRVCRHTRLARLRKSEHLAMYQLLSSIPLHSLQICIKTQRRLTPNGVEFYRRGAA
jgi:hypothetical protein